MSKDLPKYVVVYSDIYEKIINSHYTQNEILPSERELQEIYGVSRITIRRAMNELQQLGLIAKYPGIGTIVISNKKLVEMKNLNGFSEEHADESNEFIGFEIIQAPLYIQMILKLQANENVYKIDRIRKVRDQKIGFHTVYVPTRIIDLSEEIFSLEHASLYKKFHKNGLDITTGSETIEAISATDDLQKLLDISESTPILYKERTSYSNGTAIEFVKMYYIGDMYKYRVNLNNE